MGGVMVSSGGVAENDAGLDLQQRRRSTAAEKLVVTAVIASKLPWGARWQWSGRRRYAGAGDVVSVSGIFNGGK
ncbi:hypothetical protein M0R45_019824 [Rubus argutus]|uniref:Uncharacterized protein n=1 Tax=Rubus argutus TaxID=59490 RepID=A0AAW1X9Q7_RUBAR